MKIIISPSKTKKINKFKGINKIKENIFPKITKEILSVVVNLSQEEVEQKFKLKSEQAEKLLNFYKNYEKEKSGHSLASYTGIAYKAIKIEEFNESDIDFLEENLIILSALYGALTPLTELKEYRLDMTNSIFKEKSLYELWKKSINKYFENEDIILNLASKEYSKILDSKNSEKIYDFEFYNYDKVNDKLKQISTNSKKMRGTTVNYIVKNRITNVENLRNITLDDFVYNEKLSTEKKLVYIKQ